MAFGDDGIFSKTQQAVEKYQNAQEQEHSIMNEIGNYVKNIEDGTYTPPLSPTQPQNSNITISNLKVNNIKECSFYDTVTIDAKAGNSKITGYAVTGKNETPTNWISTKKIDLTNVQVKQFDNATWARVFYHNNNFGTELFADDADVLNSNTLYKYSILNRLDEFKKEGEKFEFLLQYPNNTNEYNRWKQSLNPTVEEIASNNNNAENIFVTGYEPVHIDWSGGYWGGLAKSTVNNCCYIDGSVGHDTGWMYAIGGKASMKSAGWNYDNIPGYGYSNNHRHTTSVVELWVRIDNLENEAKDSTKITINIPTGDGDYKIWVKDEAGNTVSKDFTINNPIKGMQTKTFDGATWAKVFHHNNYAETVLFETDAEVLSCNDDYKYSTLNRLEDLRHLTSEKFEFLLQYPNDTNEYNRWKQSSNPTVEEIPDDNDNAEDRNAAGYEPVHIDWSGMYWGGLTKSTCNNCCYIDGAVGHTNWFYVIGGKTSMKSAGWKSGNIPGYAYSNTDGRCTTSVVELWVRIDDL